MSIPDLMSTGVPAAHVIESSIDSYLRGFQDAIDCLVAAKESMNIEEMRKIMIEKFEEAAVKVNEF